MLVVDDCNICHEPTMCDGDQAAICAPCTPHICEPELDEDDWCDWCGKDIPAGTRQALWLPLA